MTLSWLVNTSMPPRGGDQHLAIPSRAAILCEILRLFVFDVEAAVHTAERGGRWKSGEVIEQGLCGLDF